MDQQIKPSNDYLKLVSCRNHKTHLLN